MNAINTTNQLSASALGQTQVNQALADTSDKDEQLRQAASEFINMTFYGTLMREFRESQDSSPWTGGPGGRAFTRQLDTEMIHRMSERADAPLVDAVIRQLTGDRLTKMNEAAGRQGYADAVSMTKMDTARNIDVSSH